MAWRRKDGERALCKQCGLEFVKRTYHQKFCSGGCKTDFYNDRHHKAMDLLRKQEKEAQGGNHS